MDWIKRHPLSYMAMTVATLLAGWEILAHQFSLPSNPAPLETLSIALHDTDLPSTGQTHPRPRLMILGNSQVHYVRDRDDAATCGFPARLQAELRDHGRPAEVADLSAGGQQVIESLAILIDTFDRVRPDHVVLGLGLANMRGTTIPPHLVSSCDWDRIHATTRELLDDRIPADVSQNVLQLLNPPREVVATHEPTVQEQLDELLADWLIDHSTAVRHRAVMSQWVSKLPGDLEREIRMTWRKQVRKQFKARTYDAGPNYVVSLAAVQLMATFCQRKHVALTVIAMPFHPSCTPVVYVPDDEQRLIRDLEQLVSRGELRRLDFSQFLDGKHFGTFQDGSPDGLHYLATGHALLAKAVAADLGEQLTRAAIVHRDESESRTEQIRR